MIWQREGGMGMISEPYRVGKYMVNSHLEYRLWHNDELIAECKTYEECHQMAEEHAATVTTHTPASHSRC